ncbi:MAG: M3 family metallopeptidase [Kiritimatiellae bacterium]|nr:M3 family metallopeptidase [Kiritimatiellia bacterium]
MIASDSNPLLAYRDAPRFQDIQPTHACPAIRSILETAEAQLVALETETQPTWEGLMLPLYRMMEPLGYAWGLVTHHLAVMNSEEWREAHKAMQPGVVAFSLRASQSDAVFKAMVALRDANTPLTGPQRRVLDSSIRGAELSGVALSGQTKQRFNEIKARLAALSTLFADHVLDARKAFKIMLTESSQIEGLPRSLLTSMAEAAADTNNEATAENGPWKLSLDPTVMIPFLKHAERGDLRETLYRAHVTLASDGEFNNMPILEEALALRSELASILSYDSYAEVSLATKMAQDINAVDALLETLRATAYPRAIEELDDLRAFAAEQGFTSDLALWDLGYWSEKLREQEFNFNDETLRPYFQFPRVLEGLFALTERLFDVRIRAADGDVQVWHDDVRFFNVFDADGSTLASFYLDPYSRPETKRGGAWMDPVRPLDTTGEMPTLPVAYLVCNQTKPTAAQPSLMTFSEVETLFHEFGHGLQHMLTRVGEPDASGLNNIEWDAVELASQFMENWCYDRDTLEGLSQHIDTGASLPESLFAKITASRKFHAGGGMLRQLAFAMLDMDLHARFSADKERALKDIVSKNNQKTRIIPPLPEDRTLCAFSHIFAGGYAAGYYSYKWSEVLSADAFGAFTEAGSNDAAQKEVGLRFRDTILSLGGGTDPADVFRQFRGRDPDPEALLRQEGLLITTPI